MTFPISPQRYLLSSGYNPTPRLRKPLSHLARVLSVQLQASSHTMARTQYANIAVLISRDAMHGAIALDMFAKHTPKNLRNLTRTSSAVPAKRISRDRMRGENMNGRSMASPMLSRIREDPWHAQHMSLRMQIYKR